MCKSISCIRSTDTTVNFSDSMNYLQHWYQNYRTRLQLKQLSASQLKDIGISWTCARQEADKWFWQD